MRERITSNLIHTGLIVESALLSIIASCLSAKLLKLIIESWGMILPSIMKDHELYLKKLLPKFRKNEIESKIKFLLIKRYSDLHSTWPIRRLQKLLKRLQRHKFIWIKTTTFNLCLQFDALNILAIYFQCGYLWALLELLDDLHILHRYLFRFQYHKRLYYFGKLYEL